MTHAANAARGEATIYVKNAALMLRPTFAALVAAEEELGPLFALLERAADGRARTATPRNDPNSYRRRPAGMRS
jgi:hypothetical protein